MTANRFYQLAVLAVALSALVAGPGIAEDAATLPTRKAGLWELKTTMNEGGGPRDSSLKICIDAVMEANTVRSSILEHQQSCEKYEIKKTDAGTVVDFTCKFNGRNVTSHTEMTGDFTNSFIIKITSKTSGNLDKMKGMPEEMAKQAAAQTIVIDRTITQDGKYLGESCGDLKGGEAMGPDGEKVVVQ